MARAEKVVELLQSLRITAELTDTQLSDAAARVMVNRLGAYPVDQVLAALERCQMELKGRLTIAAIVERLEDGRPGTEEAWAMLPMDESSSCVWTQEMAGAHAVAGRLLRDGDRVGARMAFKEVYTKLVATARASQVPVRWTPSLGEDSAGRAAALEEAVRMNRLSHDHVATLLPALPERSQFLDSPITPMPDHIRAQLDRLASKLPH